MAYQKLLTKEIEKRLPKLYETEDIPLEEKIVQVKFFTPWTSFTWYAVEYDPIERRFWGYTEVGNEHNGDEWGYFMLDELASIRGPFGVKIERDEWFDPQPVSKAINRYKPKEEKEEQEEEWREHAAPPLGKVEINTFLDDSFEVVLHKCVPVDKIEMKMLDGDYANEEFVCHCYIDADKRLYVWKSYAPEGKFWFKITFEDGETYEGNSQFSPSGKPDLSMIALNSLLMYAGVNKPDHMDAEHYKNYLKAHIETVKMCRTYIEVYDFNLEKFYYELPEDN